VSTSVGGPASGGGTLARQPGPASGNRFGRALDRLIPVLSVALLLGVWELISRTGVIPQSELPAMSTTLSKLWQIVSTNATPETVVNGSNTASFWGSFAMLVRGWGLSLLITAVLAIPIGMLLGSNDWLARAFRVPIEFLRPIPSIALIPLLFLLPSFGVGVKSEVFLGAFGAFWPLLVQVMYGVHDVDPIAIDTARSFGVGRLERIYRITLPSALPYVMTGIRLAANVALILVFTAELVGLGAPGLGAKENAAQASLASPLVYAIAVVSGLLGLGIHFLLLKVERVLLRWHPSQRAARA
jgi:ABC-type nitrate/sulfonate/bicarbonate transport system permease component